MRKPMKCEPRILRLVMLGLALVACWLVLPSAAEAADGVKQKRIMIVDSYDRTYLWSQSTQRGVNAAMLKYAYLESAEMAKRLIDTDSVDTPKVVVKKLWMNSKRKNSVPDMATATKQIMEEIRKFAPDLVLLGDDNAANYIGQQLLGSKIPVVFWGINGLPLRYNLVEKLEAPGQNVTGVWQSGYHKESLDLLKRLVPKAQTFAILACDSESTRPNIKMIEQLAQRGALPMKLMGKVVTNSFEDWKKGALNLAKSVDVLFVLNHDTLRDRDGNHVNVMAAGRWYLNNIKLPEASHEDQFVTEGLLLTASDSGYNQGFLAFQMAYGILEQGLNPARMAVKTPERGPYMVNRQRAKALGISLEPALYLIDELIDTSAALGR
jgi:ABC-type uncharacterized transport system substrate-binding protein